MDMMMQMNMDNNYIANMVTNIYYTCPNTTSEQSIIQVVDNPNNPITYYNLTSPPPNADITIYPVKLLPPSTWQINYNAVPGYITIQMPGRNLYWTISTCDNYTTVRLLPLGGNIPNNSQYFSMTYISSTPFFTLSSTEGNMLVGPQDPTPSNSPIQNSACVAITNPLAFSIS